MDVGGGTFRGLLPDARTRGEEHARNVAELVKAHLRQHGDHREVCPLLPGMDPARPARQQTAQRMRMMAGAPTRPADGAGVEHVLRQRALLMANRHGPM